MCFVKSQKYLAAYRFFRVLSDLCLGIPKPTPEDFFNAYISHHEEAGMSVRRDAVLQLMSRHAKWLVGEAKRYVNVQSWKDFARTGTLDIDEESDVQMDEVDNGLLTRPVPSSPAALSLSPGRKRVRPHTQPRVHYPFTFVVTERRFPVLPRIHFGRISQHWIRTRIQSRAFAIPTVYQPLRRSACASCIPLCTGGSGRLPLVVRGRGVPLQYRHAEPDSRKPGDVGRRDGGETSPPGLVFERSVGTAGFQGDGRGSSGEALGIMGTSMSQRTFRGISFGSSTFRNTFP